MSTRAECESQEHLPWQRTLLPELVPGTWHMKEFRCDGNDYNCNSPPPVTVSVSYTHLRPHETEADL
eukprot:6143943-Amphidinium_carterae.1